MADVAKNKRSQALSNFTHVHNYLTPLLANTDNPPVLVDPQFAKLQLAWEKLEAAQDVYIEQATDIDVDTDKNGIAYLDDAGVRYTNALHAYAEYLKSREAKDSDDKKRAAADSKLEEDERLKAEAQERKLADEVLKTEEMNSKFETSKTRLMSGMTAFKESCDNLQDILGDASDVDKRRELDRLESDFKDLQG